MRGILRRLTGRGEERRPAASLARLRARVLNTPLAIEPKKLEVILSVLSDRIGVDSLQLDPEAVDARAAQARTGGELPGTGPTVAVLPVHGTLVQRSMGLDALSGLTSYGAIREQIEAALADESVREIVLDIDSPGGEVSGLFDLTDFIAQARETKPITALVNEFACSAAYAIAAASSRIVAPRTAVVGSIGVIATHVDATGADAQAGLKVTHIHAGAHKADGSPHMPLSDDARADLQTHVDSMYALFVDSVARYRSMDAQKLRETEARTYLAQAALELGLVDEVAPAQHALAAAVARIAEPMMVVAPAAPAAAPADAPAPTSLEDAVAKARAEAQAHAADVLAICKTFRGKDPFGLAAQLVQQGASLDEARKHASSAAVAADHETISAVDPMPAAADPTSLLVAAARRLNERTRR